MNGTQVSRGVHTTSAEEQETARALRAESPTAEGCCSTSMKTEGAESSTRRSSRYEEMMGAGFKSMETCPMSGMCKGMMKRGAWSGWLLLLPGVLLVAGGLLVILMPKVLVWLLGGSAILMGVMSLFMANWMRRFAVGVGGHMAGVETEPESSAEVGVN